MEESAECLETDSHGRTLFCYSDSSLPVDCANFSVTELRELQFQCYTGLGIVVAAALGLAKVAIVGVTIIVKVTEEPSIIFIVDNGQFRDIIIVLTLRPSDVHVCRMYVMVQHP